MADAKAQVREMASIIAAKEADAAKAKSELKSTIESAKTEGVDITAGEAFEKIDAAGKTYDTIKDEVESLKSRRARLLEVLAEDAGERGSKAEERIIRTFGAAFTKSAEFASARERVLASENLPLGTTSAVKVADRGQTKTLLSVGGGAISPVADRQDFIVPKPLPTLSFLDVIANGVTDSDVVEYLEETTYTNSAVETDQTTAAAESAIAFTKRTANVKEIAHFIPVTRRALADAAYIESWVNNRLIDGVRRRLQTQLLSGDGTGENLTGIYNTSGIGSIDRSVTALGLLDSLHRAITTVRTNGEVEPDFIGIHPDDWDAIVVSKASTAGTYIYGNPAANQPTTLWGIPAIVHASFTSGSPLVGRGSEATLWIREGVSLAASDSHSDYFVKRQVALLATMRAAFAVTSPKAFAVSVA